MSSTHRRYQCRPSNNIISEKRAKCLLLAQSRHGRVHCTCPLSRVKQTSCGEIGSLRISKHLGSSFAPVASRTKRRRSYGPAEPIDNSKRRRGNGSRRSQGFDHDCAYFGRAESANPELHRAKHVLGSGSCAVRRPETTGAPFQRRAKRVLALAILMMTFRATR